MGAGAIGGVLGGAQAIFGFNAEQQQQQAQAASLQAQAADTKTQAYIQQKQIQTAQLYQNYQYQLGQMQRQAQLSNALQGASAQQIMNQIQQQQATFADQLQQSTSNFNTGLSQAQNSYNSLLGQAENSYNTQMGLGAIQGGKLQADIGTLEQQQAGNTQAFQEQSAALGNLGQSTQQEGAAYAAEGQAAQNATGALNQSAGQLSGLAQGMQGQQTAITDAQLRNLANQAMFASNGINTGTDASSIGQAQSSSMASGNQLAQQMQNTNQAAGESIREANAATGLAGLQKGLAQTQLQQAQVGEGMYGPESNLAALQQQMTNQGADFAFGQNSLQAQLQSAQLQGQSGLSNLQLQMNAGVNNSLLGMQNQYTQSATAADINNLLLTGQMNDLGIQTQQLGLRAASASDANAAAVNQIMAGSGFAMQSGAVQQQLQAQLAGLSAQQSAIGSGNAQQFIGLLGQGYNIYNQQNQQNQLIQGQRQYAQQYSQNPIFNYGTPNFGTSSNSGFLSGQDYGYSAGVNLNPDTSFGSGDLSGGFSGSTASLFGG